MITKTSRDLALALAFLSTTGASCAAEAEGFTGDVGAGVVHGTAVVRGASAETSAMPYLNFEYGRVFGRIDTFGVQAVPFAAGHVEAVAQFRGDGYTAAGLDKREDSIPVGIGTLQVTPFGAFAAHALHDLGRSHGSLLQLRYLARFSVGLVTVYPEVGVEAQSKGYTRYYFGTTPSEAVLLGRSYRPDGALNPFVGALLEAQLSGRWYLDAYVRYTSLDREISASPLVEKSHGETALVSLAYRF